MPGMDSLTPLFSQGVAVAVLIWFMLRLEGLIKEFSRQMQIHTRAILLLVTQNPSSSRQAKQEAETLIKESERTNVGPG